MNILIVGANEITAELAKKLAQKGHSVILVGRDASICEEVAATSDVLVVTGDYTDLDFLERQGIEFKRMDVVVIATGSDEVNLMLSVIAKNLGADRVITLVNNEKIERILMRLGIECLGFSKTIAALLEARVEGRRTVTELLEAMGSDYRLVALQIEEDDTSVGKRLSELPLPPMSRILAVFDGEKLVLPDQDITIKPGSIIIALVHKNHVRQFRETFK